MSKIAKPLGFAFLLFATSFLWIRSFLVSTGFQLILIEMFWVIGILGFFVVVKKNRKLDSYSMKNYGLDAMGILFGAITTYQLQGFLGVVLASGLIGIFGHFVFEKIQGPIFLGSFVGMAASYLFSFTHLLLAAILAVLAYILLHRPMDKLGGKSGFTAFVGVAVAHLLIYGTLRQVEITIQYVPNVQHIGICLVVLLVMFVLHRYKPSKVFTSAVIGVLFGMLGFLNLIEPNLVLLAYSFSFFLMIDESNLPCYMQVLGAVLFPFAFFIFQNSYNGFGGKLGMIALLFSLFMIGFYTLIQFIKQKVGVYAKNQTKS